MRPTLVLLQSTASTEIRTARQACLVDNIANVNCTIAGLSAYQSELTSGSALPVGSVEFVREAMRVACIPEPPNISYPEASQRFLGRKVHRVPAGQVIGTWFVKPVATKGFGGFVFDTLSDDRAYSCADRESLSAFMRLPADAPVWISEPVKFVSELRYYYRAGECIGFARYDQSGADEAPIPDFALVDSCARASGISSPFAIDFGVLDDGRSVLVEFNDFWALGLYGHALSPTTYLSALSERWTLARTSIPKL